MYTALVGHRKANMPAQEVPKSRTGHPTPLEAPPQEVMAEYVGVATLFVATPASAMTLPVQGTCYVSRNQVTLRFPATGVRFDLPHLPDEHQKDYEFIIQHANAGCIVVTLEYVKELRAFSGSGRKKGDHKTSWTFTFYPPDSPLARLEM